MASSILKKGKLYVSIYSELAKFLVETSRFDVYCLFTNSQKRTKIRLTTENVNEYCDLYEKDKSNFSLFMCLGELPSLKCSFTTGENPSIKIEDEYNDFNYNYLNWEENENK